MHTRYELYSLVAPVADNFESTDNEKRQAEDANVDFIPVHFLQSYYTDYSEPAFVLKDKEED